MTSGPYWLIAYPVAPKAAISVPTPTALAVDVDAPIADAIPPAIIPLIFLLIQDKKIQLLTHNLI
jgi:hypothetical protein